MLSPRAFKKIVFKALRIVAALVLPFFIYVGWMYWDTHKVNSFCKDVASGVSLDKLPKLAEDHGINKRWINEGIFSEKGRYWVFFVPAASTFGDVACAIHHNKVNVISAQMDGL